MKRLIAVVVVLAWPGVLLVIGSDAEDGPVCGSPDAGDCFTANGTPGCSDAACCAQVCQPQQLPFCCEVGWDAVCADWALEYCSLCDCTLDSECGDGRNCIDGTCAPIPTGGCCQCDGTDQFCEELTEADCVSAAGTYLGDGVGCVRGYLVVASCVDETIASIPDTISVEASFPIRDLEVQVLISHTWTGEICVTLRKENGPSVLLVENPGTDVECGDGSPFGCSSDHLNIRLNDHGTGGPIDDQCGWDPPALTGVFLPQEPLSVFDGLDSAGDWTLIVSDRKGSGDVGRLHRWSLRLEMPAPQRPPCSVISCACDWDLDNSGSVGIDDFLALLAQWGTDPGGPPDFDGDGIVGINDFLELLANWGPCP